jgi:hypothetical protein
MRKGRGKGKRVGCGWVGMRWISNEQQEEFKRELNRPRTYLNSQLYNIAGVQ